jgi:hypothetical protein
MSRVPILSPPEAALPPPPPPPLDRSGSEVDSPRSQDDADPQRGDRRHRAFLATAPIVLLGALAILGASLLSWSHLGSETTRAFDVPARFLLDRADTDRSGVSVGALVLVSGGLAVVGSVAQRLRVLAVLGGAAVLAIASLFIWRMHQGVDASSASDEGLVDVLGDGVYVALAGGIVTVVGAVLTLRSRARH